ncbi:MAG TPA: hypothetical protein P5279_09185 [Anaerohalosphaeraceae bacterium]|jgi:hypothetical protein|nr:hypothetical protein [Anaerohalosphaeraceae bacterium]HRT50653.1 hypothetical protein [Anaerohalosphaeraceae bacterium]
MALILGAVVRLRAKQIINADFVAALMKNEGALEFYNFFKKFAIFLFAVRHIYGSV